MRREKVLVNGVAIQITFGDKTPLSQKQTQNVTYVIPK